MLWGRRAVVTLLPTVLSLRGEAWITVAGGSMSPTVQIGERVRIVPCTHAYPGDVVLFGGGDHLLLHRVLARLPGGRFVHAGDCPGALPGLAHERNLVGRATLAAWRPPIRRRLHAVISTISAALARRAARLLA